MKRCQENILKLFALTLLCGAFMTAVPAFAADAAGSGELATTSEVRVAQTAIVEESLVQESLVQESTKEAATLDTDVHVNDSTQSADNVITQPATAPVASEEAKLQTATQADSGPAISATAQTSVTETPVSSAVASASVDTGHEANDTSDLVGQASVSATEITSINMFRLYNRYSGEHLYTADRVERASLVSVGWTYEGVGWQAPSISNTPVYRLYNPNSGDHHYTMSYNEYSTLGIIGWNQEGVGWYSDDNQTVPLLRQFNPNEEVGTHNYTTSQNENDELVRIGWIGEGIAWYAVAGGSAASDFSYIYLDAGHGWGSSYSNQYDSGACGNGYVEAQETKELVQKVAAYAESLYGLYVYTNIDSNVQYWDRQADAKSRGCTSLVSIHFNAFNGGVATGSESYIHSKYAAARSSYLQSIMHEHLVDSMQLTDRGKKEAVLSVCNGSETGIAATLLEICFIDNSYDMSQYKLREDSIARALAEGLYEAASAGF
jgi:N-acetylmuramoyl-L-alanine amidase